MRGVSHRTHNVMECRRRLAGFDGVSPSTQRGQLPFAEFALAKISVSGARRRPRVEMKNAAPGADFFLPARVKCC
jgi:hypothetical protein